MKMKTTKRWTNRPYYGCNDFCFDGDGLDAKSRSRMMEFVSDTKTREQMFKTVSYRYAFEQIRSVLSYAGCLTRRTLMEIYEKHGAKNKDEVICGVCLNRRDFKNQHMLKEMAVLRDGKMPIKLAEFLMRRADKLDGKERVMFIKGVEGLSDDAKKGLMVLLVMGIKDDDIFISSCFTIRDAVEFYKMAKKYKLSKQEMKRWGLILAGNCEIQTPDGHMVKYPGDAPIEKMLHGLYGWQQQGITSCVYIFYQREMDRICDLIGDGLVITISRYARGTFENRCKRVLKALYKLEKIIKKNPDDLKGIREMLKQEPMDLGCGCFIEVKRSK